jgi:methionine sulfoxide reductase heme-binding subunit
MTGPDPTHHVWWIASRSSGVLAMLLLTVSVAIGLSMAGRVSRNPALKRRLVATHEHTAVAAIVAIALHGITLLGDPFLKPGVTGIAVPFAGRHEPLWTGIGILGGYLVAALGLSFYFRKRIGARRWRKLHRFIAVGWAMSAVHTLGSGTDAADVWLRVLVMAPAGPVLALLVHRIGTARAKAAPTRAAGEPELAAPGAVRADDHDHRGPGRTAAALGVGRLDLGDPQLP